MPVNSVLTCNQVEASVGACVSGLGFGRFLCYQVAPLVESGRLVTVLTDFEPAPMPLSLVYPHTRLLSSRVRAMVDWLVDDIGRSLNSSV